MDFVVGGVFIAFVLSVLLFWGIDRLDDSIAHEHTSYEDEDIWM